MNQVVLQDDLVKLLETVNDDIQDAINNLKDGVPDDGDTLVKLRNLISSIQDKLITDDEGLDSFQEIVNYLKNQETLFNESLENKINVSDIINDLIHLDVDKPLSAGMGKALKDMITYKVNVSDIINDLVHTDTKKPASANTVKVLNDLLTALSDRIDNLTLPASSVIVQDAANVFKSTEKTVENILIELYNKAPSGGSGNQEISTVVTNKNFNYDTLTTLIDLSTITGIILNSIVDITNSSLPQSMHFQMLAGESILYEGMVPPGKVMSFETERTNLIINVSGSGNINMTTKKV